MSEATTLTYEEIQKQTQKQTRPIIFIIISIFLVSFLYTNIPRVINTNFYDINSDDLNSISIDYHYYSNELNRYESHSSTISKGSQAFNDIVDVISKYDYHVRLKTFMGLQQSFSSSGGTIGLFFNYGDDYKSVRLSNDNLIIDGILYKIDATESEELMQKIKTLLQNENDEYYFVLD